VRKTVWIWLLCLIAVSAKAQGNDIAITAGGYFAVSNPLNLGAAWAVEGAFAHRITSVQLVSVSAELPVAVSFTSLIPTITGTTLARSYTSLFITPGLQLKLAPFFPVSPYISAGLGYARFNRQLINGTTSSNSALAFDIGGGLDVKIAPFIGLRAELRNFNSGGLGLQTLVFGRQNNLFATAGLVFHF
jgi:Outer membrane protein beta-barrel domain